MIPRDHKPPASRTSIRVDARLDATTRAKVDDLAQRFHQPRAAVVCHIMRWGLSRGRTELVDGGGTEDPVRHLSLYVDTELREQVEQAANAAGTKMAPWLRARVRQITLADVPASWQAARSEERSHDSRTYGTRFMLRLDKTAQTKLQHLVRQFGTSKADIIRQLIIQATPEDFPRSWHMRAAERAMPPMRQQTRNHREMTR
jgi:predicted transcriptional regulator